MQIKRPRILRKNTAIRQAVQDTHLSPAHLIQPLFVSKTTEDIPSMPGQQRFSLKDLEAQIKHLDTLNLLGVALFSHVSPEEKNIRGTYALKDSLYSEAIDMVKNTNSSLQVITDVALDPYTSTGHDGIVEKDEVLNDETVDVLKEMALTHARWGADFVAPSDMMDGRIRAIRLTLEEHGFYNTGIISYSAKYASCFYGPFREALNSTPGQGDKKTYQMDPANWREALKEVQLDIEEGADVVMIKPAGAYLDIISKVSDLVDTPVAAYQVSGEYAALQAALNQGFLPPQVIYESLLGIRRAGASIIFTYFAQKWAESQKNL